MSYKTHFIINIVISHLSKTSTMDNYFAETNSLPLDTKISKPDKI